MLRFDKKTVVVTGGGSGIGQAAALSFARQGAVVHVLDLNEEACNSTVRQITDNGGEATAQVCDVTAQEAVKALFNSIGKIDVLVNSAGISHIGNVETTSEEDFDRIYKVNIKGVYNSLRAVVPLMKQQRKGVILNVSSVATHIGLTDRFAYSMSKGAVYSMTLSVARDYINDGIRSNCISPARVHTPFVDGFLKKNYPGREEEIFEKLSKAQPIGRMAKPEEIAGIILYLCSDEAAFITGSDYPIDGGFMRLNN